MERELMKELEKRREERYNEEKRREVRFRLFVSIWARKNFTIHHFSFWFCFTKSRENERIFLKTPQKPFTHNAWVIIFDITY